MSTTTPGDPARTAGSPRKLPAGIRWLLGAGGVVLIVAAGVLWVSPPPATVQVNTHRTVETVVSPVSKKERSLAARTTTHTTVTTDQILDGRSDQLAAAQPAGAASTRSQPITVALLTAGALFIILGAMPTLPSKLGFAGASAEWTPEEIAQATATVAATALSAGVEDPQVVGSVARAALDRAALEKAATPNARVDWSRVANAALREVVPEIKAGGPEEI